MCKSKNLYKLFLNNNNIESGYQYLRWTINFPNWIPANKECYVSIETCQVQVKASQGTNLTDDCLMINSNLQTNRIYSQNYKAIGSQLAQLNLPRYEGNNTADKYIKLDNPTIPVYVPSLPNSVDFWLSNDINNLELNITDCNVNFVLIIDFLDDDE